jgi:hypothetical protein
MPEHHRYLRGMHTWVGFRQIGVPIERAARHAGRTKYSPLKLLKLASDGIFAFSIVPLRAALILGARAIFLSIQFSMAGQACFRIRAERYFFQWTCPAKLAQHCVESIFHLKPKPPGVPAPLINTALLWLSRAEQETLTRLPMPFGTSLMIVGGGGVL